VLRVLKSVNGREKTERDIALLCVFLAAHDAARTRLKAQIDADLKDSAGVSGPSPTLGLNDSEAKEGPADGGSIQASRPPPPPARGMLRKQASVFVSQDTTPTLIRRTLEMVLAESRKEQSLAQAHLQEIRSLAPEVYEAFWTQKVSMLLRRRRGRLLCLS
jgi:hypothetical protein